MYEYLNRISQQLDLLEKSTVSVKKHQLCSSVTNVYCVVRVQGETIIKGIYKPKDMQEQLFLLFFCRRGGLDWILLGSVVFYFSLAVTELCASPMPYPQSARCNTDTGRCSLCRTWPRTVGTTAVTSAFAEFTCHRTWTDCTSESSNSDLQGSFI